MIRFRFLFLFLLAFVSAQAQDYERVRREWLDSLRTATAEVIRDSIIRQDADSMKLWWTVYGEKPADGRSLSVLPTGEACGSVCTAEAGQRPRSTTSSGGTRCVSTVPAKVSMWRPVLRWRLGICGASSPSTACIASSSAR